jgi:hypothetical protein
MIFYDLAICNLRTVGIGKVSTMISVTMLNTPVAMYSVALFKQCPSRTVTSVFFVNGLQAASSEVTMPTPDPITTNMII